MFDFYIHFDSKTGAIITITNESADTEHAVLKVPYAEVEKFMSGAENFSDYKISLKDKTKFKLVKKTQLANYVSNSIQVLSSNTVEEPDVTITQDVNNLKWTVTLSQHQKEEFVDVDLNFQLLFYVADSNNLNNLIRQFSVDTVELVEKPFVEIDFLSNSELGTVSLVTDKFFKKYKVEVLDEQN